MEVKIHPDWKTLLEKEFEKTYFKQIATSLKIEKTSGYKIYPPGNLIFNAFDSTPPDKVKVVIIGQDPYHGPGQAHGLSFSVPDGIKPPPSLVNIFKEITADIGLTIPAGIGNLSHWAAEGVFLLNASLTVRAGEPMSHAALGWHLFTNRVIEILSDKKEHLVFLLWGKFAHQKQELIDETKHLVLKAAHPSPFSADKGFFGCRHFSKANQYLAQHGITPIDWSL
jgi:uracil-DNA glycosylase